MSSESTRTPGGRTLALTTLGALTVALALLFAVVLPAEYGYDPLGTGQRLGLTGLQETRQGALRGEQDRWQRDTITFVLAPFEAVEYKYVMDAGATLLFSWEATGEVRYDLHAEPADAGPGKAVSFEAARAAQQHGRYTAPFNGIHGWFWQNRTDQDVTVTLSTSGFYSGAVELRDGLSFDYRIENSVRTVQP